ncbi:MAG: nucleotide exchange factor GrpE [Bacteroidia bacterium]|nr:nucleotide exchange factor GrpE [Bacteroidia bacterium]
MHPDDPTPPVTDSAPETPAETPVVEATDDTTVSEALAQDELVEETPTTGETPVAEAGDTWKEQYTRLMAEFDNYRKRTTREKETLIRTANEQLILALLPTLDDVDRALKVAETSDNLDRLREGIQLIHKKLNSALERQGVAAIPALGQPFDPDHHESIASLPVEDEAQKGIVIDEVERGYRYHGKVIRFARVVTGER